MSATHVIELAVNVDDATPEVLGHAQQALLAAGALDVWTVAIGMKKQRPGVCLTVLAEQPLAEGLAVKMLELTGSFGVRRRAWDRLTLDRSEDRVQTEYGQVRIKVGTLKGRIIVAKPEYEDARQLSEKHHVPLRQVLAAACAAAQRWREAQGTGL